MPRRPAPGETCRMRPRTPPVTYFRTTVSVADLAALLPEWRRRFRRREQVRTKYYRAGEDDYCAQLSIFEHGKPAMELTLHLPDSDQAQQAVQAFERNAERIYSDIWQSLSAKAEE